MAEGPENILFRVLRWRKEGGETLADEETMTAIRGRVHHLHQSHKYSHTSSRSLLFGPFSAPTNPSVFDPV